MSWSVPREWEGATAVCYGGGPSLNQIDIDYAISRGFRRIACNDAFLLDPFADVLTFGDQRWFLWNRHDIRIHVGKYKITWRAVPQIEGTTIHILRYAMKHDTGFSLDPELIAAKNTGLGALNLAFLFGASRILLLGYDLRPVNGQLNWHQRHKTPGIGTRIQGVFKESIEKAAPILETAGVEVINCTKDSALTCFPYRDIREL